MQACNHDNQHVGTKQISGQHFTEAFANTRTIYVHKRMQAYTHTEKEKPTHIK